MALAALQSLLLVARRVRCSLPGWKGRARLAPSLDVVVQHFVPAADAGFLAGQVGVLIALRAPAALLALGQAQILEHCLLYTSDAADE